MSKETDECCHWSVVIVVIKLFEWSPLVASMIEIHHVGLNADPSGFPLIMVKEWVNL